MKIEEIYELSALGRDDEFHLSIAIDKICALHLECEETGDFDKINYIVDNIEVEKVDPRILSTMQSLFRTNELSIPNLMRFSKSFSNLLKKINP